MIRELLSPETRSSGPRAARRRGHARSLLDWLLVEARRLGCGQIHLDSGVGIDRADAHRLYLNAGMVIAAHHFARYTK